MGDAIRGDGILKARLIASAANTGIGAILGCAGGGGDDLKQKLVDKLTTAATSIWTSVTGNAVTA
jgi:hypothetical protein